jgi:SAM-dependent methyltransferase
VPQAKTATAQPSATDVYALGRDPGESARLQRQSEELRPESAALLDRVGLSPGQHAIDLGCGPRGILGLLAERVAPGGRVVGLDADPGHVAMAREYTAQRGLVSVQIVAADARCTGLPPGSFDLVHARTLLVNVPEPAEVLAELFRTAFGRHGADLLIGRRLPELYRRAGLQDIGIEARAWVCQPGDTRRTIVPDLVRSLHPMIVSLGLADQVELDALDHAVRNHLDDPRTLVMPSMAISQLPLAPNPTQACPGRGQTGQSARAGGRGLTISIGATHRAVAAVLDSEKPDADHIAIARLSAHLAAMRHTVYPVARRQPGPARQVLVTYLDSARELDWALRLLHCNLTGEAFAVRHDPNAAYARFQHYLGCYASAEGALVALLDERLPARGRDQIAARYRKALAHAPTRPHPRRQSVGRDRAHVWRTRTMHR